MKSAFSVLLQDLAANRNSSSLSGSSSGEGVLSTLMTARFMSVFLYRLSQALAGYAAILGSVVKQLNQLITGADIAWQAKIGPGLVLYHPVGVVVGPYVSAGDGLQIQQGVTVGASHVSAGAGDSPNLGNRILLGAGSRVIGPVVLGDDCIVGANAVVTRSFAERSVLVGIPARVLAQ